MYVGVLRGRGCVGMLRGRSCVGVLRKGRSCVRRCVEGEERLWRCVTQIKDRLCECVVGVDGSELSSAYDNLNILGGPGSPGWI